LRRLPADSAPIKCLNPTANRTSFIGLGWPATAFYGRGVRRK
jgi:hypothetical protein